MVVTMIVDLDHLIADLIYDPNRCGIGFHPLHTFPAIGFFLLMLLMPRIRLIGLGLLIHLQLDALDCCMDAVGVEGFFRLYAGSGPARL